MHYVAKPKKIMLIKDIKEKSDRISLALVSLIAEPGACMLEKPTPNRKFLIRLDKDSRVPPQKVI